jgi:hypothetical protein
VASKHSIQGPFAGTCGIPVDPTGVCPAVACVIRRRIPSIDMTVEVDRDEDVEKEDVVDDAEDGRLLSL